MTTPPNAPKPMAPANGPVKPPANPPAETGKRGRKPGGIAKPRPPLPADVFNIVEVSEEKRVEHKRRREERSDQQKGIDKLVADMYTKWINAGRPTNWADMPVHRWDLPTTYAEDAEFLLRKGAQLHGRKLIFGHKEEYEKDGVKRSVLPFAVIARSQRTPRGTTESRDSE